MIAKLKGRLDSTGLDHAIIDVGGVGYLVGASSRTLAALGSIGEAVTIHTEMLVAEDMIRLVGFARADERDWYRLLTHVQGVGSRVALASSIVPATAPAPNAPIPPPRVTRTTDSRSGTSALNGI